MHTRYSQFYITAGYLVLGVLTLLAAIFYVERIIVFDAAFHLFHIIVDEGFAIQVQRFGAALSQLFPLAAVKLSLPLKWVMISYSLSFPILYLLTYLVCTKLLKQPAIGIALVLFLMVGVSETFYWIQSELKQGTVYAFIFLALINNKNINIPLWLQWLVYPLLLIFLLFLHPLMVFVLAFGWLFFLLRDKRYFSASYLVIFILLLLLVYTKREFFEAGGYDSNKLELVNNLEYLFPHYLNIESNKNFIRHLFSHYLMTTVLFGVACLFYLFHGRYLQLLLLAAFFLGYFLLINVTFYHGPQEFYMEHMYLPLAFFVALAMVFDVLPAISNELLRKLVFTGVIVFKLGVLIAFHQKYGDRVDFYGRVLEYSKRYETNRFMLDAGNVDKDKLISTWGSSFETLLLSSMQHADSARSVIIDEDLARFDEYLERQDILITEWNVYEADALPACYFNLGEGRYKVLSPPFQADNFNLEDASDAN